MPEVKTAVMLDTNICYDRFYMRDGHFTALRDSLEQLNLIWILPEIVLDEIIGKYKIKLSELKKQLKKTNQLFRQDDILLNVVNQEEAGSDYATELKELFESTPNMMTLPYPSTSHKDIANRKKERGQALK